MAFGHAGYHEFAVLKRTGNRMRGKIAALAGALLMAGSIAMPVESAPKAPSKIPTPKEFLGHEIGEDYFLASYRQLSDYWKVLAAKSPRVKMVSIGSTSEGRQQYMMIVSSPENLKHLDRYRQIAQQLAQAKGVTPAQAHALAAQGKAVVWIDGGLHANEVEPAQGMILALYKAVTDNDPEWQRILNNVIILYAQANPDGQDLNADWYMRNTDPLKRAGGIYTMNPPPASVTPTMLHHYVGHDDNRDFYMSNLVETANINNVLFRRWFPQIIYNQHQTGPAGAIVFMPPFRDPFNYNYDPLIMDELSGVGAALHTRLVSEDKAGSTMRSGAPYDTWYNGSERTISYFHNAIGILTEIIGNPTPQQIPLVPINQLPHNDLPMPVPPKIWHFSQSIAYTMSMDRAILNHAATNREMLLYNIYKMGANSIQRGSQDSWTITSDRINALEAAAKAQADARDGAGGAPRGDVMSGRIPVDPSLYDKVLHDPARRDARGYIIPADQADFPTAIVFLNALIKNGIEVEKANASFSVNGKTYPAGSFVVQAAQAYRPEIMDMFEPQDHPQDFEYPGGPPNRPYDVAGWTLAMQMGIHYDRIVDGFSGPLAPVSGLIKTPAGHMLGSGQAGWLVDHAVINSFTLTNRLLKANLPVSWLKTPMDEGGHHFGPGALWIPYGSAAAGIVSKGVAALGIDAYALPAAPSSPAIALKPVRIGLVDVYGGSMSSGWTRWLFEQLEFPFTKVYPARLDAGDLKRDFDVIVMTDGVYTSAVRRPAGRGKQPEPGEIPEQFRSWLGTVSDDKTAPQLDAFVKGGGALVLTGCSSHLAEAMKLPVQDALLEAGPNGKPRPLPGTKFYIPGSLLAASVDPSQPLAYGMNDRAMMFFEDSPTFKVTQGAPGVTPVAWYSDADPLRSGWAWGQKVLQGNDAVLDIADGGGKVFVLGPEVTQRGQAYGTFKLFFNGLYYGPAVAH
jgi:hypothetical protein